MAARDAIRAALALVSGDNFFAEHWDLELAFLHELLGPEEALHVYQPPRFNDSVKYPDHVGVITGNIYSTKKACKIFTSGLAQSLTLWKFKRHTSDSCTFYPPKLLQETVRTVGHNYRRFSSCIQPSKTTQPRKNASSPSTW